MDISSISIGSIGKQIKVFLVENDISQTTIAKIMKCSDSVLSDKLNGKVKMPVEEFYLIVQIINSISDKKISPNDFMPINDD